MQINWDKYTHAYGDARDIDELLKQTTPDPQRSVWNELYSRLCHQGTVFSASFVALPMLLDKAASWQPQDRCMILSLASSIVASKDYNDDLEPLRTQQEWTFPKFYDLTLESLAIQNLSEMDFCYLLSSACAFAGNRVWSRALEDCHRGEFHGVCPCCKTEISFEIDADVQRASVGEWIDQPETVMRANAGSLTGIGKWLCETSHKAKQLEVEKVLRFVFGNCVCPDCKKTISVSDAIIAEADTYGFN